MKKDDAVTFKIGRLAQLSGFDATVLRAWERRHGLLQPIRLSNGFRLYTMDDLALLKQVRTLLDQGFSIGDVVRMGRARLASGGETPPVSSARASSEGGSDDALDALGSEVAWSVLDALPCAVIVTDRQGHVRWVNRGVPVLCGYDLADLHGLTPGSVLQGPDTDGGAVELLRAGIAAQRPCSASLLNYHKSGEPYLAHVDVSPLGVGAKHVGFVAVVRRGDEAT